jgi:hypothetical protein
MKILKTVAEFAKALNEFDPSWPVMLSLMGGGEIAVEHREIKGEPIVAIFNSNGGRFGENPLTEREYKEKSSQIIELKRSGYVYTSIHGDHRFYRPSGLNDTCYGLHFDRRIIERMVLEGLLSKSEVDLERVRYLEQ